MYLSLYRRYRPQTFGDVTGQNTAVEVISRAVTKGNAGHAYLFSGPRGCGKTTVARLFAKAMNCENRGENGEPCNRCEACRSIAEGNCLDVVEIDGASNNRVDEIRDLKSHVGLASFSCPWKIYIVDEVHMLSIGAFNALLKTLEEPPDSVMFILATTEPFKVPVTIRSRCQHIPFRAIGIEDMVERLGAVADMEKLSFDDEALWEIARQADGGLRDGLSLLEQAMALGDGTIDMALIDRIVGGGSHGELCRWLESFSPDAESLASLEDMFSRGASVERVVNGLYRIFRDMWIVSRWGERGIGVLNASPWESDFLKKGASRWDEAFLRETMDLLASLIPEARRGLRRDVFSGMLISAMVPPCSGGPKEASAETVPIVSTPTLNRDPGIIPMLHYFDRAPHIVAALAFCGIGREGENFLVEVPEERQYSFELLSGDRNAYLLQSILAEDGVCGSLSLCWKNVRRDFQPLSEAEAPDLPVPPGGEDAYFEGDTPQTWSASPANDDGVSESGDTGLERALKVVRSQVSGEILYIRHDDELEGGEEVDGE